MQIISEFSLLAAFLDPSIICIVFLYCLIAYSNHSSTAFEGKNGALGTVLQHVAGPFCPKKL
jgi:hypothetical protein